MDAHTNQDLVAKASVTIAAPVAKVWDALVNPDVIKRYMFGATVVSDWQAGTPIAWKGEWNGKPYEDRGVILELAPERRLRYSHYSPLAGLPDVPESYHDVTIDLSGRDGDVHVDLAQDKNETPEARRHSEANWAMMLANLKKVLER